MAVNLLNELPDTCKIKILEALPINDIVNLVQAVDRRNWNSELNSKRLWKYFYTCMLKEFNVLNRDSYEILKERQNPKNPENRFDSLVEIYNSLKHTDSEFRNDGLKSYISSSSCVTNDDDKIPNILLFGQNLSQFWLGLADRRRNDQVKKIKNIGGMIQLQFTDHISQLPFFVNPVFRTARFRNSISLLSYDLATARPELLDRIGNSDRLMLVIRKIKYFNFEDQENISGQFRDLSIERQQILSFIKYMRQKHPLQTKVKLAILLVNYKPGFCFTPYFIANKLNIQSLNLKIRELYGLSMEWKILHECL